MLAACNGSSADTTLAAGEGTAPTEENGDGGSGAAPECSVDEVDGPLNFYNAVAVAANKEAAGRGVLVVINDWIQGAASLTKTSTTAVQTFMSPLRGLIGTVAYGEAEFYRGPVGKNTTTSEFSLEGVTTLPRVDIIMAHENMDGVLIDAAVAAGAKGVVIAGVGNGNMTAAAVNALAKHAKAGIICVRVERSVRHR